MAYQTCKIKQAFIS